MSCPPRHSYFFMDWIFENISSLVLHTFHLIYLAQDSNTFSIFCLPQYLYFFHGLDIENIPSFIFHTYHLISEQKLNVYVLSFTILIIFSWIGKKSFVIHTFHLICLSNKPRTCSNLGNLQAIFIKVSMLSSVLHNTCTFLMDLKLENVPRFVLHTFHLI